jgi:hypothetical protein
MCGRGFLIKFAPGLAVGKVVHLSCDLAPEGTVECKVQVRHVNADCLGARVIEMSDEARQVCRRYLDAQAGRHGPGAVPTT